MFCIMCEKNYLDGVNETLHWKHQFTSLLLKKKLKLKQQQWNWHRQESQQKMVNDNENKIGNIILTSLAQNRESLLVNTYRFYLPYLYLLNIVIIYHN